MQHNIGMAYLTTSAPQALRETVIRLFRLQSTPTVQPALQQAIRVEQQSLLSQYNFHQVLIPPSYIEAPAHYQATASEDYLLFHITGSADLINGQITIRSRSWLNDTTLSVFLPPSSDLLGGLRIFIRPPSPVDFTNIRYVQGSRNGIAELTAQIHQTGARPAGERTIEYCIAPTPRISVYQPGRTSPPMSAGAPTAGPEQSRHSASVGQILSSNTRLLERPENAARSDVCSTSRGGDHTPPREVIITSVRGADPDAAREHSSRTSDSNSRASTSRGARGRSNSKSSSRGRSNSKSSSRGAPRGRGRGRGRGKGTKQGTTRSTAANPSTIDDAAGPSSRAGEYSSKLHAILIDGTSQSPTRVDTESPTVGAILVTVDTEPTIDIKSESDEAEPPSRRINRCRRKCPAPCFCHKH